MVDALYWTGYAITMATEHSLRTFAARLRHTRLQRGYGVRELERALAKQGTSLTASAISALENERNDNPGMKTVEALAVALSVDPGWLAFGE